MMSGNEDEKWPLESYFIPQTSIFDLPLDASPNPAIPFDLFTSVMYGNSEESRATDPKTTEVINHNQTEVQNTILDDIFSDVEARTSFDAHDLNFLERDIEIISISFQFVMH